MRIMEKGRETQKVKESTLFLVAGGGWDGGVHDYRRDRKVESHKGILQGKKAAWL